MYGRVASQSFFSNSTCVACVWPKTAESIACAANGCSTVRVGVHPWRIETTQNYLSENRLLADVRTRSVKARRPRRTTAKQLHIGLTRKLVNCVRGQTVWPVPYVGRDERLEQIRTTGQTIISLLIKW